MLHAKILTLPGLLVLLAGVSLQLLLGSPTCADGLQDDVDQAVGILKRFEEIPEQSVPPAVLKNAKGLAIFTVAKAGFVLSARGGTGVVVARTDSGWSGPSAIGIGGGGFGLQIGAQVSELVVVLNTEKALQAFGRGGNVSLGADLSVAAGPIGRDAAIDVLPQAAVYTYSRSQGLFAGVSLEGTVIASRDETNQTYYGKPVSPQEILSGAVSPPPGAQKLLEALANR
ncbi:MAG TPA: YSC84-related protein [Thermodesulfobacteriota bacterium]|nr:hypothetical protein [Deltaproteobacteria bacterium]HNU71917.1 YSC84-related protein [Thermodesulfobacteriota bacterium]HOC39708.1 YSC84-related protein [Thermodesulfobacteriota bacterium]HQO78287.1 YSC84-related protein [Thermodesulfobacteriota bacterium]